MYRIAFLDCPVCDGDGIVGGVGPQFVSCRACVDRLHEHDDEYRAEPKRGVAKKTKKTKKMVE